MDSNKISYIGYHGTSAEIYKKISRDGFRLSRGGWLGEGVYFYEDDRKMSLSWAKYKFPEKRITTIECYIVACQEKVLDISNPKSKNNKKMQEFREEFFNRAIRDNKLIDLNDEEIDCKLLNLVCTKDGYEIVRNFTYTYKDFDRKCKKRSNISNGIEICVRNCSYISLQSKGSD